MHCHEYLLHLRHNPSSLKPRQRGSIPYLSCLKLCVFLFILSLSLRSTMALAQSAAYSYSPYEKVDPFFPNIVITAPREAISPLQRQPLSELTLVGTVIGKQSSALVLGRSDGNMPATYVVRVGDLIGLKGGVVVSIFSDRIIVREPLDAGERRNFSRFQDSSLMLRPFDRSTMPATLVRDVSEHASQGKNSLTEALTSDVMPKDMSRRMNPKGQISMGGPLKKSSAEQGSFEGQDAETPASQANRGLSMPPASDGMQQNPSLYSNTSAATAPLGSGSTGLGLADPVRAPLTTSPAAPGTAPAAAPSPIQPSTPSGGITIQQFAPPMYGYPTPTQGGLPNAQP